MDAASARPVPAFKEHQDFVCEASTGFYKGLEGLGLAGSTGFQELGLQGFRLWGLGSSRLLLGLAMK